ncbi:MAG: hypothetical protein K5985_04905 [Lachnospiraceae bacterium]|nr:hypothetical protein [Lachnospiraceae bacterium]
MKNMVIARLIGLFVTMGLLVALTGCGAGSVATEASAEAAEWGSGETEDEEDWDEDDEFEEVSDYEELEDDEDSDDEDWGDDEDWEEVTEDDGNSDEDDEDWEEVEEFEETEEEDGSPKTDENGYYKKSSEAAAVSTTETPELSDFDWFFDGVRGTGVPEDAENIHRPEDAVGDWKCLVIFDPVNMSGELSYHLGTLHMDCKEFDGVEKLSPHIEWNYYVDKNGKNKTDESDKDYFLSMGSFTDGWYGEDGNGNMSFRMWTLGDGKQYAWGAANLKEAADNFVVLVRP